jgi:hypothetical protein
MEVIFISGISMSLFIVVLLLTKKQKALTDYTRDILYES